jgi:DNA primase
VVHLRQTYFAKEPYMSGFVDFAALKEAVSFSAAIDLLDLDLKRSGNQWRGPCPSCHSAGARALVVTEGRGFYCWGQRKGGDQIALAAHVLELPAKEAAQQLAERAGIVPVPERDSTSGKVPSHSTVPPRARAKETEKLQPLTYLESDHEAVFAVGFDPEFCKHHGIGYAPKGVARGHVLIPFRDEDGKLLGYVGVTEAWLPADFQTNLVKFPKRA